MHGFLECQTFHGFQPAILFFLINMYIIPNRKYSNFKIIPQTTPYSREVHTQIRKSFILLWFDFRASISPKSQNLKSHKYFCSLQLLLYNSVQDSLSTCRDRTFWTWKSKTQCAWPTTVWGDILRRLFFGQARFAPSLALRFIYAEYHA